MRKIGCDKRKLRARARPRNGAMSPCQRFLKIRRIPELIPEFLNPSIAVTQQMKGHDYEIQIIRQQRAAGLRSISRHDDLRRRVGMGIAESGSAENL